MSDNNPTHTTPRSSPSPSRAPSVSQSRARASSPSSSPSSSVSESRSRAIPTSSTHPSIRYSSLLGGPTVTALVPGSVIPTALLTIKQQQQQQTQSQSQPQPQPQPDTDDTSPIDTTTQLLTNMSVHELLSLHLDDYVVLIDGFLESLSDPHFFTKGLPQHIITKILRKDQLMQQAVNRLVGHQRFERVLASLRARVAELDASIISFARTLGEHEQILHQQVTDSKQLTNIQGQVTQQRFPVNGVFHFSERLSTMSFAPPNFIEHIGMAANKPPAPLEKLMASSKLLMGVDELVAWAETERKRDRGELIEPTVMTDIPPTTTATTNISAPIPVTVPATLPTFAELEPELALAPLVPLPQSQAATVAASTSRPRRPVAALPIDLNSDLDFLDDAAPTTTADSDQESDDEL